MNEISLADARNRLSELVADVENTHARVIVTKHGHPAAVLISPDDLASLEETLDILSTPGALDEIREAEREIARGETFDERTVREDLARRARHADRA
ncbi:MAG: type II toxin-antitoxin system Phd/YefM family antitoxin [Pseudonocardiaceae bacterium]